MISAEKLAKKKIKNLVDCAQKLAAVQFQFGLRPDSPKLREKVNKTWNEFQLAADVALQDTPVFITQENKKTIGLDKEI